MGEREGHQLGWGRVRAECSAGGGRVFPGGEGWNDLAQAPSSMSVVHSNARLVA